MSSASLYTLPIELLHRIIDYTDTETIFFSFRNVCKRFYTIVNTYTQHQLDFRSLTKPTFYLMSHRIQPENVISLIISDAHKIPLQIDLFISLFDISSFTRLRSLTLIQIDESNLRIYLKYVNTCSLVSLSIAYRNQWKPTDETISFFSSFFEKVNNLQKLDLKINGLIINTIRWPKPCPVRHLSLTLCGTNTQISDILFYFPQLETLMLNDIFKHDIGKPVSAPVGIKSKPKSLTIEGYPMFMNMVISILSFTSTLIHLKLIGWPMMSDFSWDGYWWTEFIQHNLPQLRIFEFFFEKQIDYKDDTCDIESIMTPFRTPFWLEKRWYVTCDYYKNTHKLKLYSIPICKSIILYECISNKISSSNSTHDISNMMDNVHSLHLSMIPATGFTCDKVCLCYYSKSLIFSQINSA
jgi:hypothetical protein